MLLHAAACTSCCLVYTGITGLKMLLSAYTCVPRHVQFCLGLTAAAGLRHIVAAPQSGRVGTEQPKCGWISFRTKSAAQ